MGRSIWPGCRLLPSPSADCDTVWRCLLCGCQWFQSMPAFPPEYLQPQPFSSGEIGSAFRTWSPPRVMNLLRLWSLYKKALVSLQAHNLIVGRLRFCAWQPYSS